MADRTSAALFGRIFRLLAKTQTKANKRMAMKLFEMTSDYDFSPDDMNADDACITLGIARRVPHPDFPDEDEITVWPGNEGYD